MYAVPNEFQGVVYCGQGGRLYPLVEPDNPQSLPKALLPIANKPMISYPLSWLEREGIYDVIVVAHKSSNSHKLASYFKQGGGYTGNLHIQLVWLEDESDGYSDGVDNRERMMDVTSEDQRFIDEDEEGLLGSYSEEEEEEDQGSLSALYAIRPKLTKDILFLSCDVLLDIKLSVVADTFRMQEPTLLSVLVDGHEVDSLILSASGEKKGVGTESLEDSRTGGCDTDIIGLSDNFEHPGSNEITRRYSRLVYLGDGQKERSLDRKNQAERQGMVHLDYALIARFPHIRLMRTLRHTKVYLFSVRRLLPILDGLRKAKQLHTSHSNHLNLPGLARIKEDLLPWLVLCQSVFPSLSALLESLNFLSEKEEGRDRGERKLYNSNKIPHKNNNATNIRNGLGSDDLYNDVDCDNADENNGDDDQGSNYTNENDDGREIFFHHLESESTDETRIMNGSPNELQCLAYILPSSSNSTSSPLTSGHTTISSTIVSACNASSLNSYVAVNRMMAARVKKETVSNAGGTVPISNVTSSTSTSMGGRLGMGNSSGISGNTGAGYLSSGPKLQIGTDCLVAEPPVSIPSGNLIYPGGKSTSGGNVTHGHAPSNIYPTAGSSATNMFPPSGNISTSASSNKGGFSSIKKSILGCQIYMGHPVKVSHSLLMDHVHLANDVSIQHCVLGPNVSIDVNAQLSHCFLGAGVFVPAHAVLKNQTIVKEEDEKEGTELDNDIEAGMEHLDLETDINVCIDN